MVFAKWAGHGTGNDSQKWQIHLGYLPEGPKMANIQTSATKGTGLDEAMEW